ncbi:hypothetical protein ACTXT7_009063 [Hymenolepis weldensis]
MASSSEEQIIENNKSHPLTDSRYTCLRSVPLFRLPTQEEISVDGSLWLKEMNNLISYYSSIVTSSLDAFWSEVKFQADLPLSVSSFLQHCPRSFRDLSLPRRYVDTILRLRTLVVLVLQRASHLSESDTMVMYSFEHDELIYKSKLFEISSMIDLANLYGNRQRDIVTNIFASVFKENSKFVIDAVSTMEYAVMALKVVETEVAKWQFDEKHKFVAPSSDSLDIVLKTIEYVVDASCNLGTFLSFLAPVNSSVADLCIRKGIVSSLAAFYDSSIMNIRDHILRCMTWSPKEKSDLLNRLAIAGASIVKTVRVGLIEPGLVNRIMQLVFGGDSNASKSQTLSDIFCTFIDVMMEMLNHNEFAMVYTLLYPVADDISLVREAASCASVPNITLYVKNFMERIPLPFSQAISSAIDKDHLDYLQSAFSRLCDKSNAKRGDSAAEKKAKEEKDRAMQSGPLTSTDTTATEEQPPQPCCSRSSEYQMLKGIFPDIENDLIERCLEYYNRNTEVIISALLEGSVALSVTNPELAKIRSSSEVKPTPSFRPEQLWLGKQQRATPLQTLSKEDKERVINLAASVWDDEDAIGGYNYGDNDDDGREYEQIKRENERQLSGSRGEDLTYDDEYDDTFECEMGVDIERAEEADVEAELANGQVSDQKPSRFQPPPSAPPSFSRGSVRGVHQKHRYRKDHSGAAGVLQQHRQNVLQIENPEEVRQRGQHYVAQKAIRRGVVRLPQRVSVPVQPIIPEIPESEPQEPQPSISRPNQPPKMDSRGKPFNKPPAKTPIESDTRFVNQNRMRSVSGGSRGRDGRQFSNQPSAANNREPEANHPNGGRYNGGSRPFDRGGNRSRGGFTTGRGRRGTAGSGYDNDLQGTDSGAGDDSYARRLKERYGTHNRRFMADRKRRG